MTITKKDIKQAFKGYDNFYHIHTVKRGICYVISYYYGFPVIPMIYSSLLRHNINKWDAGKRLFTITV